MSERYKMGESDRPHFITVTIVDWVDLFTSDRPHFITVTIVDWVDLFTRPIYKMIIVDSLNHCVVNKSLKIYGYCIMPSHIHLIVSSHGEKG